MGRELLQVKDPSWLLDADWAEIGRLRAAYQSGGLEALHQAWQELGKDPVRYARVMGAIHPEEMRAAIAGAMVKRGLTAQDILEAIRRRQSSACDRPDSS